MGDLNEGRMVPQRMPPGPSDKYRIDLSDEVRTKLGLPLGVEIGFMREGRAVILLPVRPVEELEGMLKGKDIDFSTIRDENDKYK